MRRFLRDWLVNTSAMLVGTALFLFLICGVVSLLWLTEDLAPTWVVGGGLLIGSAAAFGLLIAYFSPSKKG